MYQTLIDYFITLLPVIFVISTTIAVGWTIAYLFGSKRKALRNSRFHRQLLQLCLGSVALIGFILALPISDSVQNQLLGMLGLLLTAIIGLSSTTFASNAMAGLMLKFVKNFRKGDFIRVDNHFGRVTERGLFHTEIQTQESNLITIPNLILITHPTTTTRQSGTIISASVSLGYDAHHEKIFPLLVKAAKKTGLKDPFAQITELGDFAVSYRIAGILDDIKTLISSESLLRQNILLSLHHADVEIVSPTFMNQKQLIKGKNVIPPDHAIKSDKREVAPESIMFQKADQAELIEKLESGLQILLADIEKNEKNLKDLEDEDKEAAQLSLLNKEQQLENLSNKISKLIKKRPS